MSIRNNLKSLPTQCFRQLSTEYDDNILITTYILDGNNWLVDCNITEPLESTLEADLSSKGIVISSGTASFIASMESADDADSDISSDVGTVLDAASPNDIREIRRYCYRLQVIYLLIFLKFSNLLRVKTWLQSEEFDPVLLPMGKLAYHLAIRPRSEYKIQADGLLCREDIPFGLVLKHPFVVMDKSSQWQLLFDLLYQVDPTVNYLQILSMTRDPLAFLGELLRRHDDEHLDHRICLACKYPM